MATATNNEGCATCNKKTTVNCKGCLESFCLKHLKDHRQELSKQLDEVEVIRDTIQQTLVQQIAEPKKHSLIEQINEWEYKSIEKIRQTAEQARQMLLEHIAKHSTDIGVELNKLTNQLRTSREEEDFVEADLHRWKQELAQLNDELIKPSNIQINHLSASLVKKISVDISSISNTANISPNARWIQNGISVVGGNGQGKNLNQLNSANDFYIDDDQIIYAADRCNNRIVAWNTGATSGQVVAGGNGPGNQANQLKSPTDVVLDKETDSLIISDNENRRVVRWSRQNSTIGETIIPDINCRGLAMDSFGYLYVSDCSRNEVKRWKIGENNGTVVAGGNGSGNRPNQLNCPDHIFVDQARSVYVSDRNNHRVMKWMEGAKEGVVVAGGHGEGNSLTRLSDPRGIVVDQLGTVYVADRNNSRVMRWPKGATQGSIVVGGNGSGAQANQFNECRALSFDRQGNLYVADYNNHRIQKFNIEPSSNT